MRTALLLTLMACSTSQQAAEEVVEEAVMATADERAPLAVLQRADAADGTEDKVVEKCSSCQLNMDGDPTHAVTHGGYELHFCSESCKERFEGDPDAVIKNL